MTIDNETYIVGIKSPSILLLYKISLYVEKKKKFAKTKFMISPATPIINIIYTIRRQCVKSHSLYFFFE